MLRANGAAAWRETLLISLFSGCAVSTDTAFLSGKRLRALCLARRCLLQLFIGLDHALVLPLRLGHHTLAPCRCNPRLPLAAATASHAFIGGSLSDDSTGPCLLAQPPVQEERTTPESFSCWSLVTETGPLSHTPPVCIVSRTLHSLTTT